MSDDADTPISDADWRTIVANAPVVSVDLVARLDGGIVLGKRRNEPLRGEWFVPGGTVFKNESLRDAVHRVARDELGVAVTIDRQLGTYEHFYDTSEVDGVDSKHYLANAFLVTPATDAFEPDDQHGDLRVFRDPPADASPYVTRYFQVLD